MIIVEGMDNSGKSTLAARLAYDLQGCVIANKRKPTEFNHFLQQIAIATASDAMMPTVLDRISLISEPVYGRLRGQRFNINELVPMWYMMNATIIHCRPPFERILHFDEREQMPGVIENARELYEAYDNVMKGVAHYQRVVTYDYTQQTYESLKDEL